MTATQTATPADIQAAVDALTGAMALLERAGQVLPQVAEFTRAAWNSADTALIIAANELKLAERGL